MVPRVTEQVDSIVAAGLAQFSVSDAGIQLASGGHIYPAFVLAQWLALEDSNSADMQDLKLDSDVILL